MSWFLCTCFTILVVCIVIQTIFMYKERNSTKELYEENDFIELNDKYKSFICKDYISSIKIINHDDIIENFIFFKEDFNKDKVYIQIDILHDRFFEEYDTKDQAVERLYELLQLIENE